MNSYRWELFRYSLPLKEPLRMLGQVLNERVGLILRLSEISRGSSAVEIFGEGNSILKLSEDLGTIPYEIYSTLNRRIKRVYISD